MLVLKDIRKSFGQNVVLDGISIEVNKGELVTFVGPSGCGKTTLLRIIGGFTEQDSGEVILDGRSIGYLPPNLRDTRICFQNYALFPHLTVGENLAYGLKIKKWDKKRIQERVDELLKLVQLEGFRDRMIDKMSGGQQQRVAFARALAYSPKVLLLDEPISNLDANLRILMRDEIRRLQTELYITTVFVTHDQFEAMAISDKIVVLSEGRIQQIGSPIEIYDHPVNEFIASFVGYVNFLDGRIETIEKETGDAVVSTEYGKLSLDIKQEGFAPGDDVLLVIRPETMEIASSNGTVKQNVIQGTLKRYIYTGALAKCHVILGDKEIIVDISDPRDHVPLKEKDEVEVTISRNVHVLKRQGAVSADR
ncbi:MAG TPA: ABC transporter ATP-binding protein [Syntrophales bacterium]|nr:ABC transporter ATP-binding protein [Syntrophales bacterium]